MPTLREWVQWKTASGKPSRYHVRLSTSGALLCGRRAPLAAAANSFPDPADQCLDCRHKARELDGDYADFEEA